jgi:hypothetical protein
MTNANDVKEQGEAMGRHIADMLKDHPNAEVRVNPTTVAPIPPHIAANLLEFLRRVQSTGMEAVAWVEAYQFIQQFAPPPPQAGVPFGGLPPAPPK